MKRYLLFLMTTPSLILPSLGFCYEAECMISGSKFKKCDIHLAENVLSVRSVLKEDNKLDRDIPMDKITQITQGEKARRNAMKSFILGPLMFFTMFGKELDNNTYGIRYVDEKGKSPSVFVKLKEGEGLVFGTSLRKMSGVHIEAR